MEIVTLLLAYVASLNFARTGAVDNGGGVGHVRFGRGGVRTFEGHETFYSNLNPDCVTWRNHGHNHPTGIQDPDPDLPDRGQKRIAIAQVVNRTVAESHRLHGELLPNSDITRCNSPFGYAIVDLNGSERLYACLEPSWFHREIENREHAGVVPEFVVHVIRAGMDPYTLEGVLTTGDAAITHDGYIELLEDKRDHPLGHVRYIKSDRVHPNNSVDADGYVYDPLD